LFSFKEPISLLWQLYQETCTSPLIYSFFFRNGKVTKVKFYQPINYNLKSRTIKEKKAFIAAKKDEVFLTSFWRSIEVHFDEVYLTHAHFEKSWWPQAALKSYLFCNHIRIKSTNTNENYCRIHKVNALDKICRNFNKTDVIKPLLERNWGSGPT